MSKKEKQFKFYVKTSNKNFLSLFLSELKKLKSSFIASAKLEEIGSECCLTVLVSNENFAVAREVLLEVFTNVFLSDFKFNYLNERILLPNLPKNERQSLVKALAVFDLNIDRQLLFEAFKTFKDVLFFESFFKFRLRIIEKRWIELVSLANENPGFFTASETFLELLKFLISNLSGEMGDVHIVPLGNTFVCQDDKKKTIFSFDDLEDIVIISNLISVCPKKIIIHFSGETENSAINLICKLFEKIVEFK